MRLFEISLLSLIVGLATATTTTPAYAEDPKAKSEGKLVGTWRLVSKKDQAGREIELPQGVKIIKLMTPTHWTAITYNEDGEVSRAFGGTYTLKDDTFEEVPEFGISSTYDLDRLKGKTQSFRCKIDGNKWSHSGTLSNGGTINEVWERVEKKQ
jgi:hypothetical protein